MSFIEAIFSLVFCFQTLYLFTADWSTFSSSSYFNQVKYKSESRCDMICYDPYEDSQLTNNIVV